MHKLLSFILFIILVACASPSKVVKQVKKNKHYEAISYTALKVPSWIINPPKGNNWAISIVPKTFDYDADIEAAKKNAAVFISRNKKGLAICKKMFVRSDTDDLIQEFNVFVSQDTTFLMNKYHNLKLNKSHDLFTEATMCLFSENGLKPNNTNIILSSGETPKWYNDFPKISKNKKGRFFGFGSSTDISYAFEEAVNKARYSFAKYVAENVKSGTWKQNDFLKKIIEQTTQQVIKNIRLSKTHFARRVKGMHASYNVWVEIEF